MPEIKMPRPPDKKYLCLLQDIRTNIEDVEKSVRNSKLICKNFGRSAANEKNRCAPEKL
jgi:hypothetical protein